MRLINIGLASINSTVGAFAANVDRCLAAAREMAANQVTIGVFPEQVIAGYPAEDLIQWRGFVDHQWPELERFARETAALEPVFVIGVSIVHDSLRYNCAAVVARGEIIGLVPKEKLPSYSIYYEGRTVSRGLPYRTGRHATIPFGDFIFGFDFGVVAVEICEDLWSPDGPLKRRTYAGAELSLNLSASVFRIGIDDTRRELIATRAADHQCTIAYVNSAGANDGLIFDGGGFVNQNGKLIAEVARFRQNVAFAVVDLDRTTRLRAENTTWRDDYEIFAANHATVARIDVPETQVSTAAGRATLAYPAPAHRSFFLPGGTPRREPRTALFEDILDGLALGVGDYFEKTGAFKQIGVSLSGGRDSLLTLLIAHRYAHRATNGEPGKLLRAFYQPSRFSSAETRNGAETICRDLGVPLEIISIDDAFERELDVVGRFLGDGQAVTELTRQNIQARLRAQRMWNWSNSAAGLFLQTGNMSEKAVGYTTVGGDLMGALAVLANVPKTVVMALLDYLHEKHGYPGIAAVLAKPAGPELAPNQRGEEELMPFPILDACFYLFAGEKLLPEEVTGALITMFPEFSGDQLETWVQKFSRLFLQSIFKWVQSPLSLHIGNLDLERGTGLAVAGGHQISLDPALMTETGLTGEDYRTIEAFRTALRRFLRFSEDAARQAGLSPQQHQLALAIRGFAGEGPPTVGEIADALQLRHHSCVGLVDRLEAQGLVVREHDTIDARKVHLRLTELGDEKLSRLTNAHRLEHRQLGSVLDALVKLRDTGSVVDHADAGERARP